MTQIITYKKLDKYLKTIAKGLGTELLVLDEKQDYKKFAQPDDLVVLPVEMQKKFGSNHSLLMVAADFTADSKKELEKLCQRGEVGAAIFDLALDPILNQPLFETILKKQEIDELIQRSSAEIQRIKRLHERLVPLRTQKVQGLKMYSKYIAGESSGGEFFDFFSDDKTHYVFMVSSSSYLATSHTISQFEFLSGRATIDESQVKNFLEEIYAQVRGFDIPDLRFDLLLMKFDLKTMELSGYNFGESALVSDRDGVSFGTTYGGDLEAGTFGWKLERGERVVALSAGINRNCKGFIDQLSLEKFITKGVKDGPQELLTELFFQLKRSSSSTFLKFDASAIYIEVDKNVFIEV